jgi:alcohol dehydrogenase class IV
MIVSDIPSPDSNFPCDLRTGAVHGFAAVLGGRFEHAPHGALCAVLLPYVFQKNAQVLQGIAEGKGGQDDTKSLLDSPVRLDAVVRKLLGIAEARDSASSTVAATAQSFKSLLARSVFCLPAHRAVASVRPSSDRVWSALSTGEAGTLP